MVIVLLHKKRFLACSVPQGNRTRRHLFIFTFLAEVEPISDARFIRIIANCDYILNFSLIRISLFDHMIYCWFFSVILFIELGAVCKESSIVRFAVWSTVGPAVKSPTRSWPSVEYSPMNCRASVTDFLWSEVAIHRNTQTNNRYRTFAYCSELQLLKLCTDFYANVNHERRSLRFIFRSQSERVLGNVNRFLLAMCATSINWPC